VIVVCDGSPANATLAAAHGALFEHCPVDKDVLSFSALTGVRSGTTIDALTTKQREEISGCVSKLRACGKECYSPQTREAPLAVP
jgi:hypothetical protein